MSVSVWCELVCGECSETSEGCFSRGALPKGFLLDGVKRRGWIVEKDEVFCSSACRNHYHIRNKP